MAGRGINDDMTGYVVNENVPCAINPSEEYEHLTMAIGQHSLVDSFGGRSLRL